MFIECFKTTAPYLLPDPKNLLFSGFLHLISSDILYIRNLKKKINELTSASNAADENRYES